VEAAILSVVIGNLVFMGIYLGKVQGRLNSLISRIERMENHLSEVNERLSKLEGRIKE